MLSVTPRFPAISAAVLATAFAFAAPFDAQAAIIQISPELGGTMNRLQDSGPVDFAGDAVGPASNWAVGKHGNGNTFKTGYIFNLANYQADIAEAENIKFSLDRIANVTGTEPNKQISLIALSGPESASFVNSDYQRAGDVIATVTAPAVGEKLVVDVTSWVKADALAGNYTSFRLQIADPQLQDGAGTDHYSFYFDQTTAALVTAVPEPASIALLGLAGLGMLRRRGGGRS